jgi:hypothetical protein
MLHNMHVPIRTSLIVMAAQRAGLRAGQGTTSHASSVHCMCLSAQKTLAPDRFRGVKYQLQNK